MSDPVARLRCVLSKLKHDPSTPSIVDRRSIIQMASDVTVFAAEEPFLGIRRPHSSPCDVLEPAKWIKDIVQGTGTRCELQICLVSFAPNVV